MELRDYQEQLGNQVMGKVQQHGPGCGIMMQLPTGGGKTRIGGVLLLAYMDMFKDRPHAWVTHRRELRGQSSNYMRRLGLPLSVMAEEPARFRKWHPNKVNVVSPALRKWPPLPAKLGVMVIDEAHHTPAATWSRLIEAWQFFGGIVIGLTATPWRLSKTQGFEQWYNDMVCGPSIQKLQSEGYLATPRVHMPREALISDEQAKLMSTGDYAFDWMEAEVSMLLAHKPVVEEWKKVTKDRKDRRTMWFVPTVHCAQVLAKSLGERARVLTAETPSDERDRMLAELKFRRIDHLISVDVLGEGIDVPSVPIIASLRPTQSVAVWLQQCGRGSRPKNKKNGGHYMVIDYAGNCMRHGTPDMPREWSLKPRQQQTVTLPQQIVARCFELEKCCDIMLHPANRKCWNCGGDQYIECSECHVHRRWTQIGKNNVCAICQDYQKEQEAKQREDDRRKMQDAIRVANAQRRHVAQRETQQERLDRRFNRFSRTRYQQNGSELSEQLSLFK